MVEYKATKAVTKQNGLNDGKKTREVMFRVELRVLKFKREPKKTVITKMRQAHIARNDSSTSSEKNVTDRMR